MAYTTERIHLNTPMEHSNCRLPPTPEQRSTEFGSSHGKTHVDGEFQNVMLEDKNLLRTRTRQHARSGAVDNFRRGDVSGNAPFEIARMKGSDRNSPRRDGSCYRGLSDEPFGCPSIGQLPLLWEELHESECTTRSFESDTGIFMKHGPEEAQDSFQAAHNNSTVRSPTTKICCLV